MVEVLLVSIGGFFGAISRYAVSKKIQSIHTTGFPIGTLFVNLLGAFLLGFLYGMGETGYLYMLIGVGFMGAFTTFSTLKLEAEQLRKTKYYYGYLLLTYLVGIPLAYLGLKIGEII